MTQSSEIENEGIGERIRRFRKERKISQAKLADLCGVTMSWISQVETGKENASPSLLNKMASALKVPIRDLLRGQDHHMELITRIKLVEVLLETDQTQEAESTLYELFEHPDITKEDSIQLEILRAECKLKTKDYYESANILKPLIASLESMNYFDANVLACCHNLLGSAYICVQDFYEAYSSYRRAYELISRFVDFDFLAAKISYNVALSLIRLDKPHDSLFYLEQAEQYYRQANELRKLADALVTRGIAYKNIKDFVKAVECFDQAKAILQIIDHEALILMIRHTVATEITFHDDPDRALEELSECLERYVETHDLPRSVLVHAKMASILQKLSRMEKAFYHLMKAEEIVGNLANPNIAEVAEYLRVRATYSYNCKDFKQSIDLSSKSSELFGKLKLKKDQAVSLQVAISSYKQLGDLDRALSLALECNPYLN